MKSSREHEEICPLLRPRSASNSENSRPITSSRPRPVAVVSPHSYTGIRDRCDSLPSRPRTISEGQEVNSRYIPNLPFNNLLCITSCLIDIFKSNLDQRHGISDCWITISDHKFDAGD